MRSFLIKRILQAIGVILCISAITFFVLNIVPGDPVRVMMGDMMELAPKAELFDNPSHPYTQALLDVIPRIRQERIRDKNILQGDVPSPTNPPSGCCFHTRCAACMGSR